MGYGVRPRRYHIRVGMTFLVFEAKKIALSKSTRTRLVPQAA